MGSGRSRELKKPGNPIRETRGGNLRQGLAGTAGQRGGFVRADVLQLLLIKPCSPPDCFGMAKQ